MTRAIRSFAPMILAGFCTAACATAPKATTAPGPPLPQKVEGIEGAHENTYRDGRVLITGQPSEEALAGFRDLGVLAVVCVRTPKEMEDRERVEYDEPAAVERLGMEYVNVPLGGKEHPYTPAALDDLVAVLDRTDGDVLLHCGMGGRAAYLWAAYLVRERGWDVNDALEAGRAIAIGPDPLEGLLGQPLPRVSTDRP